MKSSAKKIELASVDDLFSTEESRQDEQLEKIQVILSILVDTFSSRISLTMPPSPKPHNTACVLS